MLIPVAVAVTAATVFAVADRTPTPAAAAAPPPTTTTAPADADPNPDCTLIVPPNPLSAKGLSTPYQLTATDPAQGACDEANDGQSAFVEATIINTATGALSVYRPLVVDAGSQPAAPEIVPKLPAHAVVGIWFGFNGDNLTLRSQHGSLRAGNCVNGSRGSIFGQFAFCDAAPFFAAAHAAIRRGQITIPAVGTGKDGLPCMTTRDYGLVDQDQSDNVITSYLVLPDGSMAQDNSANAAALSDSTTLVNGSDNLLLDGFVDPALGCATFDAPDLTDPGHQVSSLALNELLAAARQANPIALVPEIDPMTLDNGRVNRTKTNLYRAGVNMVPFNRRTESAATYCADTLTMGARRIQQDKQFFLAAPSPDTGAANNLYTFMAQRWDASLTNLDCDKIINIPPHPVRLVTDPNGVVVDAIFPTPKHHR
ncbi:MAG TPA: hypothetical protein VJX10_05600 [Pseudonocardiaceae bacterium]|nr:hypothetical protein [Pseudonocardiaceae bacterium]